MHVDCLLDGNLMVVFNGKREEVRDHIEKNQPFPLDYSVYEGYSNKRMTVEKYMEAPE